MSSGMAFWGRDFPTENLLLDHLHNNQFPIISLDVETVSVKDQTLIGIGIGLNQNEAIYFRVLPNPCPYLNTAWSLLDRAETVILHNAIFDLTALLEYFISDAPWWGEVGRRANGIVSIDTSIACKIAAPQLLQSVATKSHDNSLAPH